jgi:uncharacterized protein (TIGR02172 family)
MNKKLSQPLARGRTAEVFPWGSEQILKLYQPWCSRHWIENEIRASHAILEAGIPSPAPGEIVQIEGRTGLVFERVEGVSMLAEVNQRPWKLLRSARVLAELQARINQLVVPGLPPYREELRRTICFSQHIPEAVREKAISNLASLPEAANVCHGDFHPGNVLLTHDGPIVIDWMTASAGDPWADVARTSVILKIGVKGAGKEVTPILWLANRIYHRAYLSRYHSLFPEGPERLGLWLPVMAAARLNENIAKERGSLLHMAGGGYAYA